MSQSGILNVESSTPTIPTTFTTDSSNAIPSLNEIKILGESGVINTSGSGNTVTINLTAPVSVSKGGTGASTLTGVLTGNGTSAITANPITRYSTIVGGASNAVSSVGPSATSGIPLISQGSSANPTFGTAVVAGGGTGATTLTSKGVLFGNGTSAVGVTAALDIGQIVIGRGVNSDPYNTTAYMQQGIGCWFMNLSFTISAGVLTIHDGEGGDLSGTNRGYVAYRSNITESELTINSVTSNQVLTISDLTNNLFGTTTGVAWGSSMPFYVGFSDNATDSTFKFFIFRLPHLKTMPSASTDIGQPSSAVADKSHSAFSFSAITQANYTSKNVGMIGSFTMTKDASNVWTADALTANDGTGRWNDSRMFTIPTGQNGAASGKYFAEDANTAPGFSTNAANYMINKQGIVTLDCQFVTVNVAGTGTDILEFCLPIKRDATSANKLLLTQYFDNSAGANYTGNTKMRGDTSRLNFYVNDRNILNLQQQDIDTTDQIYFYGSYLSTSTE